MRQVIFIPDLEDGGYVAEVPSLPGCYSQGETLEEAKKQGSLVVAAAQQ